MSPPRPWSCGHHGLDTPPDHFGGFARVVTMWRSRRGVRRVPCWADMEFDAFAGWHDMMVLDAITYGPFDARTVIWGSRLAEIAGYQPRGLLLSESREMRGLLDEDFAFLERVCAEPCIGLATGQLDWRGRDHVGIARLYLPFAPAADAPVDRLASFCEVMGLDR